MRRCLVLSVLLSAVLHPGFASAAMKATPLEWAVGGETFRGVLVYDDEDDDRRPGLVMVPNWMGVTDAAVEEATRVAGDDYVVLVADVYGKDVRPKDKSEAGAQTRKVFADGGVAVRERAAAAVTALKAQAGKVPLDPERIAAFGYCFGGTVVLELARSGATLAGGVSLHGGLDTWLPKSGNQVTTPLLVLNGADDKMVTAEHIAAFEQEMDAAGADWQFMNFGGARHCFSQVEDAHNPPDDNCLYNERAARRAYRMMDDFFDEVFDAD